LVFAPHLVNLRVRRNTAPAAPSSLALSMKLHPGLLILPKPWTPVIVRLGMDPCIYTILTWC